LPFEVVTLPRSSTNVFELADVIHRPTKTPNACGGRLAQVSVVMKLSPTSRLRFVRELLTGIGGSGNFLHP